MLESVSEGETTSPGGEASQPDCRLHVCTSCRPAGAPREPKVLRAGFLLYEKVRDAIENSALRDRVSVVPAECLSLCPRPCGIALSRHGAWTYLFGDQHPNEATDDLLNCISLYLESQDGFMGRQARPKTLRGSILGRVPPISRSKSCT